MELRAVFVAAGLLAAVLTSLGKPESSGPDPDAILATLYKAHDAESGPFSDPTDLAVLERFFTSELAALIAKDAKESAGEVGAIGFDPLYESQDPQITDFKVGEVHWGGILKRKGDEPEEGLAVVEITFKDGRERRSIPFRFQQQPDNTWRIADINYSDGSSLAGLIRDTYPAGGDND